MVHVNKHINTMTPKSHDCDILISPPPPKKQIYLEYKNLFTLKFQVIVLTGSHRSDLVHGTIQV